MDIGVFGTIAVIFLLAFMVESLVEALFGTPFDKIPVLTPYKWTLQYIAVVVGVIGAWVYQFDLLSMLAAYLKVALPVTVFGVILTGLAIGRGSNYLHDLVMKFFKPVTPPEK